MRYRNAAGEITDRVVTLMSTEGDGEDERWLAFCHLRGAVRRFKPANAVAFYDPATGAPIDRDRIAPGNLPARPRAIQAAAAPVTEPVRASTILFIDVETTGLSEDDRIVSLGAVKLRLNPPGEIVALHLIFNPERRCSKRATELHGYDNRTLARQDPFGPYAQPLRVWCAEAELVVAHNAAFDLRFVNEAFRLAGVDALTAPVECTMLASRARHEGAASLDAVSARIGLPARAGHDALSDAWRCMQVFLWQRDLPWRLDPGWLESAGPANYREPAPKRSRGRPRKRAIEISGDAPPT